MLLEAIPDPMFSISETSTVDPLIGGVDMIDDNEDADRNIAQLANAFNDEADDDENDQDILFPFDVGDFNNEDDERPGQERTLTPEPEERQTTASHGIWEIIPDRSPEPNINIVDYDDDDDHSSEDDILIPPLSRPIFDEDTPQAVRITDMDPSPPVLTGAYMLELQNTSRLLAVILLIELPDESITLFRIISMESSETTINLGRHGLVLTELNIDNLESAPLTLPRSQASIPECVLNEISRDIVTEWEDEDIPKETTTPPVEPDNELLGWGIAIKMLLLLLLCILIPLYSDNE